MRVHDSYHREGNTISRINSPASLRIQRTQYLWSATTEREETTTVFETLILI